jgi:hypothetical protein
MKMLCIQYESEQSAKKFASGWQAGGGVKTCGKTNISAPRDWIQYYF